MLDAEPSKPELSNPQPPNPDRLSSWRLAAGSFEVF
jgi:hypothetical protein